VRAIKKARGVSKVRKFLTVLFIPEKTQFTNTLADSWLDSGYTDIVFVSGRYEGFDDRVRQILVESSFAGDVVELSVGPYVLTGGEIPSLLVADALVRRLPGVLGNSESIEEGRSASHRMYTKPAVYSFKKKDYPVPAVLLSGNHAKIDAWREEN
jgi:tRNA (guanine37-N1)-methyltransferase